MRPLVHVIPRDEALYRLSVFAAAVCIAVMLAALFAGPSTSLDRQGMLIAVSVLAIGACVITLVTVERLLRTLRRQRAEIVDAARSHADDLQTVVELARRLPASGMPARPAGASATACSRCAAA